MIRLVYNTCCSYTAFDEFDIHVIHYWAYIRCSIRIDSYQLGHSLLNAMLTSMRVWVFSWTDVHVHVLLYSRCLWRSMGDMNSKLLFFCGPFSASQTTRVQVVSQAIPRRASQIVFLLIKSLPQPACPSSPIPLFLHRYRCYPLKGEREFPKETLIGITQTNMWLLCFA
jgi:hypothetical protein